MFYPVQSINQLNVPAFAFNKGDFSRKILEGCQKLSEVARDHFNLLQSFCLLSYGGKEVVWDGFIKTRQTSAAKTQDTVILDCARGLLKRIEKGAFPVPFHSLFGSLHLSAGVASGLAALQESMALPFEALSGSLFFIAQIVALRFNVKVYQEASQLSSSIHEHERKAAQMLKKSAVLGIISTLNYMTLPAITLLGGPAAMILIFGCIALFTGCLKVIYDFFYL
jgi:hypothetical protein